MPSVEQLLAAATQRHRAGQLTDARALYQQVLQYDADNAQALQQAGALEMQAGQLQPARELLERAVRVNRQSGPAHAVLGDVHRQLGRLADAARHLELAVKLNPQVPQSHAALGALRYQQGDTAAAVECYRQAVKLKPDDPQLRFQLGQFLLATGQLDASEASFRRVLVALPQDVNAHFLLGHVLHLEDKLPDALESLRRAVALAPAQSLPHGHLGIVLQKLGQSDEALAEFREAIRLDPNNAEALSNLGSTLSDLGRPDEALPHCRRAYELNPNVDSITYNLGYTLYSLNLIDEALEYLSRAVAQNPSLAAAHGNLGNCLKALGQMAAAVDAYRTSDQLNPRNAGNHSNLLYAMLFAGTYDEPTLFREHCAWGARHADSLTAQAPPHTNDRDPNRPLRVGYVSAHFCLHAVNFFGEPILREHDRSQFSVYCYSNLAKEDGVTQRIRNLNLQWRDIAQLSDEQAAKLIREDKIDILVDLAGHISGGRLLVFARKPAPVQVTYIGYQHTTGMRAMDYRLTDAWSDPPGQTDAYYTEKLVRLPRSFFCYLPVSEAPLAIAPPAEKAGHVTFGSFNNFAKISAEVLATWAEIMRAVPNSRLSLLTVESRKLRDFVQKALADHGIGIERLQFVDRAGYLPYLNRISSVDIALDPFPFNGHTTTCDTLWMGVPVVAMAGDSYVSRYGSSALVSLGLEDLIARNREQYVSIATRLAGDLPRLNSLRRELRANMLTSPVCDAVGFTRNLEAAYRQMWQAWCSGSPALSGAPDLASGRG